VSLAASPIWTGDQAARFRAVDAAKQAGDDLRGLPTGQVFAGIPFDVTDPAKNQRKTVLAISRQKVWPPRGNPGPSRAGCITFCILRPNPPRSRSAAASPSSTTTLRHLQYLIMEKHLTYWWFSNLKTDARRRLARSQPGRRRCRTVLVRHRQSHPEKTIRSLCFQPPDDDGIYALVGLTLADRAHYVAPNPVSFGGPDDWAAATAMAALIEGLAGVKDSRRPRLILTAAFAALDLAKDAPVVKPSSVTPRRKAMSPTLCVRSDNPRDPAFGHRQRKRD